MASSLIFYSILLLALSMFAGAFGGATHRMRFKDKSPSPLGGKDAEGLSVVAGAFGGATNGICFKNDPFFS